MNKDFFELFLKKTGLDDEKYIELKKAGEKIILDYGDYLNKTAEILKESKCIGDCEQTEIQLCQKTGYNRYTVDALSVISGFEWLYDEFNKAGYSDEVYWDTVTDLKYKVDECLEVKKVCGTFVANWYNIFFKVELFKLGRLEYQLSTFKNAQPVNIAGITLNDGDAAIYVHIPSCGPLDEKSRLDSYKKAYEFFGCRKKGVPLVLVCGSWLMYNKNSEIFPKHSNMVGFLNDWKNVVSYEYKEFDYCWRIFGCDYDGNPDNLVADNSARRSLVNWLKQGKKVGGGTGVLVFDGEKIIKE